MLIGAVVGHTPYHRSDLSKGRKEKSHFDLVGDVTLFASWCLITLELIINGGSYITLSTVLCFCLHLECPGPACRGLLIAP